MIASEFFEKKEDELHPNVQLNTRPIGFDRVYEYMTEFARIKCKEQREMIADMITEFGHLDRESIMLQILPDFDNREPEL